MMNYKKRRLIAFLLCGVLLCACSSQEDVAPASDKELSNIISANVAYDEDDIYQAYDEDEVEIIELSQQTGTVEITKAGTYLLQGNLHGSVHVEASKEDTVRLILDNVTIDAIDGAAIACTQAKKLILSMPEGTVNTITDSNSYTDQSEDAPTSAIFAQDDLTINGSGTLQVNAQYKDAIKSKDTLKLMEGTYEVTAAEDAIIGKDFLYIHAGTYTVTSAKDGFKTTYDTDTEKGDMVIENGLFKITAENDAFQSEHQLTVYDGTFSLVTGGGSVNAATSANANQPGGFGMWNEKTAQSEDTPSAKGIKAGTDIAVHGGTFQFDTSDDGIHANGDVSITDGNFTIATGDDGMHADGTLMIDGGTIDITKSYEGLEGCDVVLNGGYIQVTSSDDGINAAGGSDSDNEGQPSPDFFSATGNHTVTIEGATIQINAGGDGLDSNGSVTMSSGTVVIFGPEDSGNAALDYDSGFDISGGILIAVGNSGMAQATSESSTQNTIMANISTQSANTIFYLTDQDGNLLLGVQPIKSYSSVVISTPDLHTGESYSFYTGGSGGSVNDKGYIESGLTGGTLIDTVELSSSLTTYGSAGMGGGPGGMGREPGDMGGEPNDMGRGSDIPMGGPRQ